VTLKLFGGVSWGTGRPRKKEIDMTNRGRKDGWPAIKAWEGMQLSGHRGSKLKDNRVRSVEKERGKKSTEQTGCHKKRKEKSQVGGKKTSLVVK